MRTFSRVVLPVMIIVGLVAGLAYISQYTPPTQPNSKAVKKVNVGPTLNIPERVALWDSENPNYSREVEFNSSIMYDFWAGNTHTVPANVVLRGVSCGKCTHMDLGLIKTDAAVRACQLRSAIGSAMSLANAMGFDVSGLTTAALLQSADWTPLAVNEAVHSIPGADAKLGIQLAIFRFRVDGITMGSQRISGDINYSGGDPKPAETHFEVPIVVVTNGQVAPNTMKLDDMKPGEIREVKYVVWTSTRDSFELKLPPLPDDPNFVFGTPKQLTAEECQQLERELPLAYPTLPPTHLRAAYAVSLLVHENLNGQLMELGPFTKKLTFNAGTPFEAVAMITGSVRGDIQVETKDNDQTIALGNFRADLPLTRVVLITSPRSDLKLRHVSTTPDAAKVTVKERPGVGSGWELRLEIPANSLSGPLPVGSSIVLEISGSNPRRVRIPLTGVAFLP